MKNNKAPKQGSVGYWTFILIFIFLIPFIFMAIYLTMIFYQIHHTLFVFGIPISFAIAYYFVRGVNKKLKAMSEKEYNKCFKCKNNTIYIQDDFEKYSVGYWCYIGFCTFIMPFIFITPLITIIIYAISEKFILLGPIVGLTFAYLIANYKHNKISRLNESEYKAYFKKLKARSLHTYETPVETFPPRQDSDINISDQHFKDHLIWDPYDPSKTEYWTTGPGKDLL